MTAEKKLPAVGRIAVSDLWRWDGEISRSAYAFWGLSLSGVKFGIDHLVAEHFFHRSWSFLNYIIPGGSFDILALSPDDQIFFLTLVLLSLPFIWVGCVLTVRRLRSAGLPVWLVKLFFIPVANFIMFFTLCVLPGQEEPGYPKLSRDDETNPDQFLPPIETRLPPPAGTSPALQPPPPAEAVAGPPRTPSPQDAVLSETQTPGSFESRHGPTGNPPAWLDATRDDKLPSAIFALVMTVPGAAAIAWFGATLLGSYGWGLFVGLSFAVGMVPSYLYGRSHPRSLKDCLLVSMIATTMVGAAILFLAWEGVVCLIMASPIAYFLAIMGSLLGWALQRRRLKAADQKLLSCMLVFFLPALMGAEYAAGRQPPRCAVVTSIDIQAPPEKVWPNIIAFPELEPPREPIFWIGIAYPTGATINGAGPGAVRHCRFSTGSFVEPITVWDEPRLLAFSVTAQPAPMQEFSFYRQIQPAHLEGYLDVEAGQFELQPRSGDDGRVYTRITGTTWYRNHMWPAVYWRTWTDAIMHQIHLRVLRHIKTITERSS